MNMNLEIIARKCNLNNIILKEIIDVDLLDKLINSSLLKKKCNNKLSTTFYESEKEQLIKYKKLIKNGIAYIKYKQAKKMNLGRVIPDKSLGLFSIRKAIRHTLCKNTYIDIDIVNCHPILLYQISKKHKFDCKYLKKYCKNRDEIRLELMEYYGVSKEDIKDLFLVLLYFGSFNTWLKDLEVKPLKTDRTEFIINYTDEIKKIGNIICENNIELKNKIKSIKDAEITENKKGYNLIGSVVSYFLQEKECIILETVYNYCIENKLIENNNAVLCADGIMILKEKYNDDLLLTFSNLVKDKTGFKIKFESKEFNQGFSSEEIENAQLINIIEEQKEENKIVFNKRYLLDMNLKLNQHEDLFVKSINENLNNDTKTILIKSPYDTGKTQLMKEIIKLNSDKRILWVSYRISLTNDIYGNFKNLGFESYLTGKLSSSKLIIQLESLRKLEDGTDIFISDNMDYIPYFDLVIIDEVEGILNQFSSYDTIKGTGYQTFNLLSNIIDNSKKLICLDGDINQRTYDFIKPFGKHILLHNNIKINKKDIIITKNKLDFYDSICSDIDLDLDIVICTQSSNQGKVYNELLKIKYPNKNIKFYYSKTDDNEKMKLDNVIEEFDKANILIYTSTIEAGVSFDKTKFSRLYGVFCQNTNSQRAYFQMMARVRKFDYNNVLILCEKMVYNDANLYTFDEIKKLILSSPKSELNIKELIKDEIIKDHENKNIKLKTLTNYGINYCHNLVEEKNKHQSLFLQHFKQIAEDKGHNIIINDKYEYTKDEKERLKIFNEKSKQIKNNQLLTAEDIKQLKANKLNKLQMQHELTEKEKYELERYYYKKLLGVDNLDDNIINKFCKNSKIKNFINLIDEKNYNKDLDDNNLINYNKLVLVKNLIHDLGFENIFSKKYYNEEDFKNIVNYVINNNELFKNKSKKLLFNKLKKTNYFESNKAFLGFINSILESYSIKIEYFRKQDNGTRTNFYRLQILDNIDELIWYKINFKKQKIYDSNNIFSFTKTDFIYRHLINETINNDEIDEDEIKFNDKIIYDELINLNMDEEIDDDYKNSLINKLSNKMKDYYNSLECYN